MRLYTWVLSYSMFLVLLSLAMIIVRKYLLGLKIIFTSANLVASLAPLSVTPQLPAPLVYSATFAVLWCLNLSIVNRLRVGGMIRRREMFDGWQD